MKGMKSIWLYTVLGGTLCALGACSDDNSYTETIPSSTVIRAVDDFTDPRDGHVYKCVQIGDQIWMAENLAYYPEGGSYEGCYTWNESTLSLEDVSVDASVWAEIATNCLNDPQYDWAGLGYNTSTISRYIMLGQILGNYTYYMNLWRTSAPEYYLVVNAQMEIAREENVGPAALAHRQAAEEENGGYSQTYGYLYSYDAAREAVPEGWRLPSDSDWKKLELALGMSASEADKLNAWRGSVAGDRLKRGGESLFDAIFGGCLAYAYATAALDYMRLNDCAYFWTSAESTITEEVENDGSTPGSSDEGSSSITTYREGIIRQLAVYSSQIWRGTTRIDNTYYPMAYSVRCVRDAQ